jgi:hypothetical protein
MVHVTIDEIVATVFQRMAETIFDPTSPTVPLPFAALLAQAPRKAVKPARRILTSEDAAHIKFFLATTTLKNSQIAALLDLNGGRVTNVKQGTRFPRVRARQPSAEVMAAARVLMLRNAGKTKQ